MWWQLWCLDGAEVRSVSYSSCKLCVEVLGRHAAQVATSMGSHGNQASSCFTWSNDTHDRNFVLFRCSDSLTHRHPCNANAADHPKSTAQPETTAASDVATPDETSTRTPASRSALASWLT